MKQIKRNVDVIVGMQHGDEGKGKIINELCEDYDVNVRMAGGANSGHTVYTRDGAKVVFNIVPSGMLNKNIIGVITQGVVMNPYDFSRELDKLKVNIPDINDRLYVSSDISLTVPTHILIDHFTELNRSKGGGNIIGSTKRGNTPTYVDKIARRGLRLSDASKDNFKDLYMALTDSHIKYITRVFDVTEDDVYKADINGVSLVDYEVMWQEALIELNKTINKCNTVELLHKYVKANAYILLECAQGAMLDIDYGTYPFVTSSSVTASAAFAHTGIPVQCVNKIYGVFKPYVTRVGNGFFPTEIKSDAYMKSSDHIVETGKEFGSVTGRRRKIGWLDMPQLKYACMVNGITDLIMMKCDIMSDIPTDIMVAHSYSYENVRNHEHEIYKGDKNFVCVNYKFFKKFGDVKISISDEMWEMINYIDDYVSDVVTNPKVSIVSSDPKLRASLITT